MYTLVCIDTLLLTIIGAYYSKNSNIYKGVTFTTHTTSKNSKIRTVSLFNTGLLLFNLATNSEHYILLPLDFILYNI